MKKLPVALQLYTVRDAAEKDFFGVLAQVKAMGYDYVEMTADFFGKTAQEIRAEMDRLGLICVSSHVPIDMLLHDLDNTLTTFQTLGCQYIAVPSLDEPRRPGNPGYAAVVEGMQKIGRACYERGMTLLYHNHDFEFIKVDGEYALDILYNSVDAKYLQSEIDTCWVNVAGVDPAAYVRKYANRCPVVHLKDFVMPGKKPAQLYALIDETGKDDSTVEGDTEAFDFRPVGLGVQNFPAILEAAGDAGARYVVVEQDRSSQRPSLEAARISREYLKSLGF